MGLHEVCFRRGSYHMAGLAHLLPKYRILYAQHKRPNTIVLVRLTVPQ